MRIISFFTLLMLLCFSCSSKRDVNLAENQEEKIPDVPCHVPVPEGWTKETFAIPISFAPSIPFRGVEEVRFTKDWANKDSAGYWSYVFVWYLEGETNFTPDSLGTYLGKYYTGLVNANMGDKPKAYGFREAEAMISRADSPNVFSGDIHTLDYMRNVPFVLSARIFIRSCEKDRATAVIFEISPQPDAHPIWNELAQIQEGFRCRK